MEIYFYCNYTNSGPGFCLKRLEGDGAVPVTLSDTAGKQEKLTDSFFSFDRFRVLWQEIAADEGKIFSPEPEMSFFGIRGIHGEISGVSGVVNFAMIADEDELDYMESLATGILSDIGGFCRGVFPFITADRNEGYRVDAPAFMEYLSVFAQKSADREIPFYIGKGMSTAKDLLRFGVYTGSADEAVSDMGPFWLWLKKPKQLISEEQFKSIVGNLLY